MNLDNCGYKPWKLVIAKERKTQRMKRERERRIAVLEGFGTDM